MTQGAAPTGTVAFLFTDVEGSTRLWETQPEAMGPALRRHDAIMRDACAQHEGVVFKTIGDAFCVAFATAGNALLAALQAQRDLESEPWPEACRLRVRMAIHVGTAEARDSDYFGPPLNRVARLVGAGHGGQLLLSQAAHELVRDQLPTGTRAIPLGEHRLKDLTRPEPVYQVQGPGMAETFAPIQSLSSQPNNLPLQTTNFIGREKELADLTSLLRASRLLTLTGAGGTGKTRLSLQAAADSLDHYPDGVWFVELAPLGEPSQVAGAVAEVLEINDGAASDLVKRLTEEIGAKKLLLVLDNCEHLIEAVAKLCDQLLRVCGGLTIVASSREPLRVPGEQTYRVPPLSMPQVAPDATVQTISQYEAVRLFIDRALLQNPAFQVTNENAPDLAMLCAQLDGIPLALELAAARVRNLPVGEITKRLDQRFQMLTSGVRTALPRQQTLRALVDWSYDLLSPSEKVLLCRMSVFAGGFDHERAEAVGGGDPVEDWECLDLLSSLVDKSLVMTEDEPDGPRYRLQETIRQYAEQRLRESGDEAERRARHLRAFADRSDEAAPHLHSADQLKWLRRLQLDMDNFRAALRWGFGAEGNLLDAVRLAARLGRFWYIRGAYTEGASVCEEALARAEGEEFAPWRGRLHASLGLFAFHRAEYAAARDHFLAGYAAAEDEGRTSDQARLAVNLGNIAYMLGDFEEARSAYTRSLDAYQRLGEEAGIGLALNNIACALMCLDQLDDAERAGLEGLEYRRRVGDPWHIAYSLMCLADIALLRKQFAQAKELATEALAVRREIGDQAGVAESELGLARIAVAAGQDEEARGWLRAARESHRLTDDRRAQWTLLVTTAMACRELAPTSAGRLTGAYIGISERSEYSMDGFDKQWVAQLRGCLAEADIAAGRGFDIAQALAEADAALNA